MADEFVKLSKSLEPNLDLYLTALDRYMLERYNKITKDQKFIDKIRNKIGITWDFVQLYEKAQDQSKKNKTNLILEYIDLLGKTKNIGDDWITNDDVRKAVDNIKNRLYEESKSKFDEASKAQSDLKKIFDEVFTTLEKISEKIRGFDKKPLTQVKTNITGVDNELVTVYDKMPILKK